MRAQPVIVVHSNALYVTKNQNTIAAKKSAAQEFATAEAPCLIPRAQGPPPAYGQHIVQGSKAAWYRRAAARRAALRFPLPRLQRRPHNHIANTVLRQARHGTRMYAFAASEHHAGVRMRATHLLPKFLHVFRMRGGPFFVFCCVCVCVCVFFLCEVVKKGLRCRF